MALRQESWGELGSAEFSQAAATLQKLKKLQNLFGKFVGSPPTLPHHHHERKPVTRQRNCRCSNLSFVAVGTVLLLFSIVGFSWFTLWRRRHKYVLVRPTVGPFRWIQAHRRDHYDTEAYISLQPPSKPPPTVALGCIWRALHLATCGWRIVIKFKKRLRMLRQKKDDPKITREC